MKNRFVRRIKNELSHEPLSFILLAAGVGRRIYKAGSRAVWKHPSLDCPIIVQQIKTIRGNYPDADIVVVLGYDFPAVYSAIQDLDVRVVENPRFEDTGPIASLRAGLLASRGSISAVLHTDIIFTSKFIRDIQAGYSHLIYDAHNTFNKNEIGLKECQGKVISMRYDWPTKWANLAVFREKELSLLRRYCLDESNARNNVFEAVNNIIDNGGNFKMVPAQDKVYEIDSHIDYNKLLR